MFDVATNRIDISMTFLTLSIYLSLSLSLSLSQVNTAMVPWVGHVNLFPYNFLPFMVIFPTHLHYTVILDETLSRNFLRTNETWGFIVKL
jgi:hypothetical protein